MYFRACTLRAIVEFCSNSLLKTSILPFQMIDPLPREDRLHLNAAEGWIGLGDAHEGMGELRQISDANQEMPMVLEVYWSAHAVAKEWESAFAVAEKLVEQEPKSCFGWVHRAFALRRMEGGGIEQAWDALLPAAVRFPKEPIVPYNLSCYCAQLNRLDEAKDWMDKAISIGHSEVIKKMAMEDPDLDSLVEAGYFE